MYSYNISPSYSIDCASLCKSHGKTMKMNKRHIISSLSFSILSFLLHLNDHSTIAFSSPSTPAPSKAQSKSEDPNETPIVDVAISGAGPSGLALAHCLIDRGYKVKVLERRSTFRPVGSAVFLHPFALNSLKNLSPDVAANVLEAATQVGTVTVKSLTNSKYQAVFDQFDNAPGVFGSPFVTIKFWDLLQSLRMGLPEDIFSFGSDVQGYHKCEDGSVEILYTTEGSDEKKSVNAKMIIDASGIRSKIRKQILPDSQSVPVCKAYMAVLPADKAKSIMSDTQKSMTSRELGVIVGETDGMTLATLENGDVWWSYTYLDEDLENSMTREELVERVEGRFPPFIAELLGSTEDRVETVIADLPVSWKWGEGMVTLLGDSAHAQLPALGLGCSTAFADIEELCKQIDSNGLHESALRRYERWRMPQTAVLQTASRFSNLILTKI